MVKSMDKDRSSPSEQSQQAQVDETSLRSSTDAKEESRPEADTDPDTEVEQSIPVPPGLEFGASPQTGALVTLLSKISSVPIEVVRALEELKAMIDERVLRAIGAFRREITSGMDAHEATSKARMDAHEVTSKARMDSHDATVKSRLEALDAKFDSIRREMRLVLAVLTLVLTLLAALFYLGFVERTSVRGGSTATTTQQVQVPIPDVEEQSTPTSNPGLGTSAASGDVSGPNGDTPNADGSSLPTDP